MLAIHSKPFIFTFQSNLTKNLHVRRKKKKNSDSHQLIPMRCYHKYARTIVSVRARNKTGPDVTTR